MNEELTPWFDGKRFKPVYVGVYQSEDPSDLDCIEFRYWNGFWWGCAWPSKSDAFSNKNPRSFFQSDNWRGLANDPKAKS